MTTLPAPYCFSFSLFYVFHSRALSHALARASPYCSPSHVIVPSAHCFCYDWVLSEEGKTSETGRSAELAFVQRDWS